MTTGLEADLVDAARALLDEGGVGAVTVREVARRCGVSHGAPRRHFPTLTSLHAAVAERCLHELHETVTRAEDDVRSSALAYVAYAVAHPHAFDLITRHDLLAGSGRDLRATSLPLLAQWRRTYARGYPGTGDLAATAAWASVHGVAVLASRRALDVVGVDADTLISAILPWPPRGAETTTAGPA